MSGSERGWRSRAACRGWDPELFFPAAEDGPEYRTQVAAAKHVCSGCPVRAACLAEALVRIPHGIAGGLTPEERRDLAGGRGRVPVEERARLAASPNEVAAAGVALRAAGRPVRSVAGFCGVTERTVTRWVARARMRNEVTA
jgi:hypothetical protein